ncbi:MAG: VOC family protein [Betaproteobacteria bacterium]
MLLTNIAGGFSKPSMKVVVHPLTLNRWRDVESVFNAKGCAVARGCWCIYDRLSGKSRLTRPGEVQRTRSQEALKHLAAQDPPPGLIGYRGKTPLGRRSESKVPMIRGMHAMFYSSEADALRTFIKEKLGFPGTDVGGGWLIFDAPEADLGVHPTENNFPPSGTADISFYCDNIEQTVAALKERGVEFTQDIEDHGYGLVTYFKVPGAFKVQLYQPRYAK